MANALFSKYEALKHHIRSYERVGVAFSGGVDSSLLLMAAGETLPREDVIALHGKSQLNFDFSDAEELYHRCFRSMVQLRVVELDPLSWPEFVNNDGRRCYFCKKKNYSEFLKVLKEQKISTLLDGTNVDDLQEDRAGLAVLSELGVKSPLVAAGLRKNEIRFLAASLGLPNHDAPSNSCLATRLRFMPKIEAGGLQKVKGIEEKLRDMGFRGHRAKPSADGLRLEIRHQDFSKLSRIHNRLSIIELCVENGFENVYLDIRGR